ncbi:hypothetical protein E1301_Tti024297 [Triplophysa tibetana]|uniref:Uncharacterized protein n=1 Tax=Triplophysa tibetana TaxID=1572043 RepID=A0A5A9NEZ9_9TELE|nr:hypothetical protein E1301_Tti024297 [Triplophysa tibetana]
MAASEHGLVGALRPRCTLGRADCSRRWRVNAWMDVGGREREGARRQTRSRITASQTAPVSLPQHTHRSPHFIRYASQMRSLQQLSGFSSTSMRINGEQTETLICVSDISPEQF